MLEAYMQHACCMLVTCMQYVGPWAWPPDEAPGLAHQGSIETIEWPKAFIREILNRKF